MKVKLKNIKPTSKPIRELESEDIEALTQSIKEFGLLQPFRVRPIDDGYEVIFGNARLDAAKRAGLEEVEVVVADVDDDQALIEAGVENLLRSDMSEPEKGRWSLRVRETMGWSQAQLARRLGLDHSTIAQWESLATNLPPDLAEIIARPQRGGYGQPVPEGQLSAKQAREIARVRGRGHQRSLAEKAMRERLSGELTREVRQAIEEAPDEKIVEKILERPWVKTRKEVAEEIEEAEVEAIVERLEVKEEEEKERAWWREHPSTKEAWKYLKMYRSLLDDVLESVEREKIPPEHCNFLANFLEKEMIPYLQGVVARLREKAKKW